MIIWMETDCREDTNYLTRVWNISSSFFSRNKKIIFWTANRCFFYLKYCRTRDIPRKSQAFPKADGRHTILFNLEGQACQWIFHSFPQIAVRNTHALPLGAGRNGFSSPLAAGRHGFSCTSIYNGGLRLSR